MSHSQTDQCNHNERLESVTWLLCFLTVCRCMALTVYFLHFHAHDFHFELFILNFYCKHVPLRCGTNKLTYLQIFTGRPARSATMPVLRVLNGPASSSAVAKRQRDQSIDQSIRKGLE